MTEWGRRGNYDKYPSKQKIMSSSQFNNSGMEQGGFQLLHFNSAIHGRLSDGEEYGWHWKCLHLAHYWSQMPRYQCCNIWNGRSSMRWRLIWLFFWRISIFFLLDETLQTYWSCHLEFCVSAIVQVSLMKSIVKYWSKSQTTNLHRYTSHLSKNHCAIDGVDEINLLQFVLWFRCSGGHCSSYSSSPSYQTANLLCLIYWLIDRLTD